MARAKQSLLEKRCKLLYSSLQRRVAERKNKHGRIIRHGRQIPFTYEQLLQLVMDIFVVSDLASPVKRIQCKYCTVLIDYLNCAFDHEIPLKRGGGLELNNLTAICRECNNFKGGLAPNEFRALRAWLSVTLCDAARMDIEGRLKKATKLAASVNWARKNKTT